VVVKEAAKSPLYRGELTWEKLPPYTSQPAVPSSKPGFSNRLPEAPARGILASAARAAMSTRSLIPREALIPEKHLPKKLSTY